MLLGANMIIIIILTLGVCTGIIALQIFLSGKENKFLGLILPIISFGISLMTSLSVVLFSVYSVTTKLEQNGEIIEQSTIQVSSLSSVIGTASYIFILYNIPTAILIAIYMVCRGKRKKQRALEKMSAQDLG